MDRKVCVGLWEFNEIESVPTKCPDSVTLRHHFGVAAWDELLHMFLLAQSSMISWTALTFFIVLTVDCYKCSFPRHFICCWFPVRKPDSRFNLLDLLFVFPRHFFKELFRWVKVPLDNHPAPLLLPLYKGSGPRHFLSFHSVSIFTTERYRLLFYLECSNYFLYCIQWYPFVGRKIFSNQSATFNKIIDADHQQLLLSILVGGYIIPYRTIYI